MTRDSRPALEAAREADANGEPEAAIRHFELARAASSLDSDDYLDLAVLYMECCDLGIAFSHRLPRRLEEAAYQKAIEVLGEAARRFPGNTDVAFWMRYIPWAVLGEPIEDAEIRGLAARGDSLVPYLYLRETAADQDGARRLLASVRHIPSTRARYVASVLRST